MAEDSGMASCTDKKRDGRYDATAQNGVLFVIVIVVV